MTTVTATPAVTRLSNERPRLTFGGVLSSECTKLLTLRSTAVTMLVMLVVYVGFSVILATTFVNEPGRAAHDADAAAAAYNSVIGSGVSFGQLVVGVLAVLVMSSEYTTGLVQSTMTSVPRRLATLGAKSVVVTVVSVVLSVVASALAYVASAPLMAGAGIHASLLDPTVLLGIAGNAFYLVLIALFSLMVATIVRSSAGAIAVVMALLFVLPLALSFEVAGLVPSHYFLSYPIQTLSQAFTEAESRVDLAANIGLTIAWVGIPTLAAIGLLKRRDV